MEILILLTIFFLPIWLFSPGLIKKHKKNLTGLKFIIVYFLITFLKLSHFVFFIGLLFYSADYKDAIEMGLHDYTPLSYQHILSPIILYSLFVYSCYKVWVSGIDQPPLALVSSAIIIILGVIFSVAILKQVSFRQDNDYLSHHNWVFFLAPISSILVGVLLIISVVKDGIKLNLDKKFENEILNTLNTFVVKLDNFPTAVFVLILPISTLIILILVLFGQESESFVKVFTETATWRFSEHKHPPFLQHQGHYLCTVAAQGSPETVKPLRLGKRYGHIIIVNRQLLIANGFEHLISSKFPRFHKVVRELYDTYGYPLSTKIKNAREADIVYFMMKPLEWLFLIIIYFFHRKPEELINSQYQTN